MQKCQRVGYLNQIAQKVIEKFPSRVIFITYDDTCSNQDLQTSVSVMTADEGEYEIACDLIEVAVCSKDHPRVPFVILPTSFLIFRFTSSMLMTPLLRTLLLKT